MSEDVICDVSLCQKMYYDIVMSNNVMFDGIYYHKFDVVIFLILISIHAGIQNCIFFFKCSTFLTLENYSIV